jgi:hypothetical protein
MAAWLAWRHGTPLKVQVLCGQVSTGGPEHQVVLTALKNNEVPAATYMTQHSTAQHGQQYRGVLSSMPAIAGCQGVWAR